MHLPKVKKTAAIYEEYKTNGLLNSRKNWKKGGESWGKPSL